MFYSPAPTFPIVPRSPLGLNSRPKIVELFEKAQEPRTWAERVGIFKKEKPLHERHQMLQNLAESYPNYNAFLVGDKSQVQFSRFQQPYQTYNFGVWDTIREAFGSRPQAVTPAPDLTRGSHSFGRWKLNNGNIVYGCEGQTDRYGRPISGGTITPEQQRAIVAGSNGAVDAEDYGRIVNAHLNNLYGLNDTMKDQTVGKIVKDKNVWKGHESDSDSTHMAYKYGGHSVHGLSDCNKNGFVNFALFQTSVLGRVNNVVQKPKPVPSDPLEAEIQKITGEIKEQRERIKKLSEDWHRADPQKKATLKVQIESNKKRLADTQGRLADARTKKAKAAEVSASMTTVNASESIPHSAQDIYLYSRFFSHLGDKPKGV